MSNVLGISPISTRIAGQTGSVPDKAAENAKIDKSAKDFESLLLTSWLQQAYSSFGSVPGEDEEDGLNSGKEQFQAIAMQSLGTTMTAAGGLGIAKMIAQHLHKSADAQDASADAAQSAAREVTSARALSILSTNRQPIEIPDGTSR